MRFSASSLASSTTLLSSLLLPPFAAAQQPFYKGLNIGATNPDGTCKSPADWTYAFEKLKSLPGGGFTSARLYASSDCNTLANAIPPAQAAGMKLLVGVWTQDEAHFTAEKNALEAAIRQFGADWILAIAVGSEDLYRKETPAWRLAEQIYDVRGMVGALGVNTQVGHVDTWTAWVDGANEAVITASDFVGMDGYPYFEGAAIEDAAHAFWQSVGATRAAVDRVKPGTWVWLTETSWPARGDNFGAAVASVANAERYYKTVGCAAFQQMHSFWYSYQDYNAYPSFGVFGQDQQPVHDMSC